MLNVSTVTVQNNVVWVGSNEWGMARMWATNSPQQLDLPQSSLSKDKGGAEKNRESDEQGVFADPGGDPWRWQYYYGPRWLTSNQVFSVISDTRHLYSVGSGDADVHHGKTGSSVWAITSKGLSYISLTPWTLENKAKQYATFQLPQHDRHGLSTSVGIGESSSSSSSFSSLCCYSDFSNNNDDEEFTNLCNLCNLCFLLFLFIYFSPSIFFSFLHYLTIHYHHQLFSLW